MSDQIEMDALVEDDRKYFRYLEDETEVKATLSEMLTHEPDWVMSKFRFMESELQRYKDADGEAVEEAANHKKIMDSAMLPAAMLNILIDLKNHKDEHGKDIYYLQNQPECWKKAKIVMEIYHEHLKQLDATTTLSNAANKLKSAK